jgi:Flp pilus assembly pilin Flp
VIKKNKVKGVTIVEYAVMLSLVAIAVAISAPNIAAGVLNIFGETSSVLVK